MSRHTTAFAVIAGPVFAAVISVGLVTGCEPPPHDEEAPARDGEGPSSPAEEDSPTPAEEDSPTPAEEDSPTPAEEDSPTPAEEEPSVQEEDPERKKEYDKSEREEESDKLPRLSDGELNEVIDEEFGNIRRCVLRGLDDVEPASVESWYVGFAIDTGGRVDAETFSVKENAEEDVTDTDVGRCLKAIFVELEFSPSPARRGVQYPLYVQ